MDSFMQNFLSTKISSTVFYIVSTTIYLYLLFIVFMMILFFTLWVAIYGFCNFAMS